MSNLSLSQKDKPHPEPTPLGKLLVLKSGKVILRVKSTDKEGEHIDFEVIKGIETNFYQEIVTAHPSKPNVNFLGPLNHKLIAVPDLDAIF